MAGFPPGAGAGTGAGAGVGSGMLKTNKRGDIQIYICSPLGRASLGPSGELSSDFSVSLVSLITADVQTAGSGSCCIRC